MPEVKKEKKIYEGVGNPAAPIMIIGSHPSVDDIKGGKLLADGEFGYWKILQDALIASDIPDKDIYYTVVVKEKIAKSKPSATEVKTYFEALDEEIARVKPRLIIALGSEPFKRLMKTNIKVSSYVGELVDSPYGKILVNYSIGMVGGQDPTLLPEFAEIFEYAKAYVDGTINHDKFEYVVVDDPEINKQIIAKYIAAGQFNVGYDAEWFGEKFTDDEVMYTFQYSCEKDMAIILDISKDGLIENRELLDTMKPLLEHPNVRRMGWNIRADDKRLTIRDFKLADETLAFDGMKAVAMFDSRWSKGLETGIKKFTKYPRYYAPFNQALRKAKLDKNELAKLKFVDEDMFYNYCAGDAVAHREACLNMMDQFPKELAPFYYNTYLPLSNYILDMEVTGIPIDMDVLKKLTEQYNAKYTELNTELLELVAQTNFGEDFNPRSAPQKKKLLFETLKLTPAYWSKSGKLPKPKSWYNNQRATVRAQYSPSTNGKTLMTIRHEMEQSKGFNPEALDYRIVKTMLNMNRVGVFATKFLSTKGVDVDDEIEFDDSDEPLKQSYWAALCRDGRIHADFFECLENFRSSSRVNVQNPASKVLSYIPDIFVPGYTKMTKADQAKVGGQIPDNLRNIFYSGSKDYYWAEVDVAGADLQIAAYLSKDRKYIHDMLSGNFHLKKARQYFRDEKISKDDYSKYVSAKSITFRVAYTAELNSAALPIQAEIYAESGVFLEKDTILYALNTWNEYEQYIRYREECKAMVDEHNYIKNARGMKLIFAETDNFGLKAGYYNQSLAYPIASELACFVWDLSVQIRKQMQLDKVWMKYCYPVNTVHDAKYWVIHKDLLNDNYFPELCREFFTKRVKIVTGNTMGMEMHVGTRWKASSSEQVFHGETAWDFETNTWKWKK